MATSIGAIEAELKLNSKEFDDNMANAEKRMTSFGKEASSVSRGVESSFKNVAIAAGKVAIALAGIGYAAKKSYDALTKIAETRADIDSISRAFEFATGSAERAADEFAFVKETSERLGVSLESLAKSYSKLTAAASSSSLTGEQVREIFLSISEASSVLGLSAENVKFSFKALQDMMSKGVISAEEVKTQLGDHLPGAMNIFADAIGVTTKRLQELMKAGQLAAVDVLPLVAKHLREKVASQVGAMSKSVGASLARMQNSWFQLRKTFVESEEVMGVITSSMNFLTSSVGSLTMAVGKLDTVIKKLREGIAYLSNTWANFTDVLVGFNKVFNKVFGIDAINKLIGFENTLENVQKAWNEKNQAAKNLELYNDITVRANRYTKDLTKSVGTFSDSLNALKVPKGLSEIEASFLAATVTLQSFEDAIVNFIETGEFSFEDFAKSIIAELTRVALHLKITIPLLQQWANLLSGSTSAGGGSLLLDFFKGFGKTIGMASGGVIEEPILGIGLNSKKKYALGEKGPEAVVPLSSNDFKPDVDTSKGGGFIPPDTSSGSSSVNKKKETSVFPFSDIISKFEMLSSSIAGKRDPISPSVERTEPLLPDMSSFGMAPVGGTSSFNKLSPIDSLSGIDSIAEKFSSVLRNIGDDKSKNELANSVGSVDAPNNTYNINISAVDSESLVKLMRNNPEAVTVPISESINMGDRGLISSIRGAL